MLLGRIPFPVCVLFMSFCVILGTSGAPFMDCLVCDRTACDPASADVQFTEDVLYLPEPYFMVPTDVDTVDSSTGTVCMWSTLHVRFQVLYTTTVYTVAAMYVFTTRMNVIAMPVPSMYARGKLLRDSAAAGVQSTYIHLST